MSVSGQDTVAGSGAEALSKHAIDMSWVKGLSVIAVTCFKGGVGKTTFVTAVALMLARMGKRVLVIDFNSQGNTAEDFGLPQPVDPETGEEVVDQYGNPVFGDGGEALANSIMRSEPLRPIQVPGREDLQLDLCPGGHYLKKMKRWIFAVGEREMPTVLARSLAPVAQNYDYVLIDSPPEDEALIQVVIAAVRWVWIVTRTDESSLRGFRTVAGIFREVKDEYNPHVEVLGAALTASTMQEGSPDINKIHAEMAEVLDGAAAVCPHTIPYIEKVARNTRLYGKTVIELEEFAKQDNGGWPDNEQKSIGRLAAAITRMGRYMVAVITARNAGYPYDAVVKIDERTGQPVMRAVVPSQGEAR